MIEIFSWRLINCISTKTDDLIQFLRRKEFLRFYNHIGRCVIWSGVHWILLHAPHWFQFIPDFLTFWQHSWFKCNWSALFRINFILFSFKLKSFHKLRFLRHHASEFVFTTYWESRLILVLLLILVLSIISFCHYLSWIWVLIQAFGRILLDRC